MSKEPFNVAVVGYGLSAKVFHIPLILAVPALRLYAIIQRSPKPEDDAKHDFPQVKCLRSSDEVMKDPAVDLVVLSTIPETHFELAKQALLSGKHVVVEKPFTPTSKEADELIALAEEKKLLITVYQSQTHLTPKILLILVAKIVWADRRWDSDFLTVSQLIRSDTLGRIAEFETHFDRHRPEIPQAASWKAKALPASGAIYDLGTHLIDQIVHLFGLPKKITGFIGSQRDGDTGGFEDSFIVLLHYEKGLIATAKAGVVSPEVNQLRYWVRGVKGSFKKFHLDCQEDQLKKGMRPGDEGFGIEPQKNHGVLTTTQNDGSLRSSTYPTDVPATYVEFYRILSAAMSGKGRVPVRAEEARDVIRLIELAKESSELRRSLDV
ncbi:MAG: hypothetical protein M1829_004318 [Trizodia sp. TS-e1964]|nr:MAG: hypothetical protein M1829_004318 [Trizodia sp. TS-e1964]